MLTIKELSVSRGSGAQQFTVNLPKLSLQRGEIVAISGASGCGKSTLLETIGLVLNPTHVSCYQLNGIDNNTPAIHQLIQQKQHRALAEIRAKHIGFMLQSGGLLPFLSVRKNITLPCEILGNLADTDWLNTLCQVLNIAHLLSKHPNQLSIGERQRVAFIRAISHKPLLLLADEPTSALDPEHSDRLFSIMVKLAKQQDISILIVTHDHQLIQEHQIRSLSAHTNNSQAIFKGEHYA